MVNVNTRVYHVRVRVLTVRRRVHIRRRLFVHTFAAADAREAPGGGFLLNVEIADLSIGVDVRLDACNLGERGIASVQRLRCHHGNPLLTSVEFHIADKV